MDETPSKLSKDEKFGCKDSFRTNCGLCCVCHVPPVHSRSYYGHIFCTDCFYKYIFSAGKPEYTNDIAKKEISKDESVA